MGGSHQVKAGIRALAGAGLLDLLWLTQHRQTLLGSSSWPCAWLWTSTHLFLKVCEQSNDLLWTDGFERRGQSCSRTFYESQNGHKSTSAHFFEHKACLAHKQD